MATDPFKITIHMVSSLDGYIAKKDNTVSWFETSDFYENGATEPDVVEFLKTIDCYIMGSRTYEHALELSKSYGWVYGVHLADEIRQSVLPIFLGDGIPFFYHTGQEQPLHLKNVTAYKSGIVELCYEIKK